MKKTTVNKKLFAKIRRPNGEIEVVELKKELPKDITTGLVTNKVFEAMVAATKKAGRGDVLEQYIETTTIESEMTYAEIMSEYYDARASKVEAEHADLNARINSSGFAPKKITAWVKSTAERYEILKTAKREYEEANPQECIEYNARRREKEARRSEESRRAVENA